MSHQLPELPTQYEELRAYWKCDSCDGRGHDGEMYSQGFMQPPELGQCGNCQGSGQSTIVAYTDDQMRAYAELAIASVKREPQWLPIESAPKGQKLIVGYFNKLGNWRTIIARYYLTGTLAASDDADEDQCDEEGYAKEGWYEESETHEFIMQTDEEPLYYMLLTPAPVAATTASREESK